VDIAERITWALGAGNDCDLQVEQFLFSTFDIDALVPQDELRT